MHPMHKTYHVEARWDPAAEVWVSKSDIPGLTIETATLAEFEVVMKALARDLLAANICAAGTLSLEWKVRAVFDL